MGDRVPALKGRAKFKSSLCDENRLRGILSQSFELGQMDSITPDLTLGPGRYHSRFCTGHSLTFGYCPGFTVVVV